MKIKASSLRVAQCGAPDCNHDHGDLMLAARCHPRAGTKVLYKREEHSLDITCAVCDAHVVEIELEDKESCPSAIN